MRNLLTIGMLPALLLACTPNPIQNKEPIEDRQEAKGKISVPLTAKSTSGATYRLDLPSVLLISTDETLSLNLTGASEIDASLQEGEWKLLINKGWDLYRIDGDEEVLVESELVGENPQSFKIEAGKLTKVLISFKTLIEEEILEFQEGDLQVDISIDDGEPEENEETEVPGEADETEEVDETEEADETETPDVEFVNQCNGQICLTGPLEEGFGFAASGRGHGVSAESNSSFYSFGADSCLGTGGTNAFYSFATMDYASSSYTEEGIAGGYGEGIGDNFSNLRMALFQMNASISDLTVSFGWLDLGDDVNGEDYIFFTPELEWRLYSNNDNSSVEIKFNGEPMLIGTMTSIHLELDYNEASDCSDDYIRAHSDPIFDFQIAENASLENVLLGQALLEDAGDDGLWLALDNPNSPITRDRPFFEASNATLGTGDIDF